MKSEKDILFDSIFKGEGNAHLELNDNGAIKNIKLDDLKDFHTGEYGHVFEVDYDTEMEELEEQIKEDGILEPIIVRKDIDGKYEKVSGHRRCFVAKKIGLDEVPCIVMNLEDEEAIKLMVVSNLSKRKTYKPSTLARAYKSYMEANLIQSGERTDLCRSSTKVNTREEAAKKFKTSSTTIQEYIRLTNLIPLLLELVDSKKIKRIPAVNISYLSAELQQRIYDNIQDKPNKLTLEIAENIKKEYKSGKVATIDDIDKFFPITMIKKEKIKINEKHLLKFMLPEAENWSSEDRQKFIEEAIPFYMDYCYHHPKKRKEWNLKLQGNKSEFN